MKEEDAKKKGGKGWLKKVVKEIKAKK